CEDQIERQLSLPDCAHEPRLYEVFRTGIGGRQKEYPRAGECSGLGRLAQGTHNCQATAGSVAPTRRPGSSAVNNAENTSARNVPGATVEPSACSTGTDEKLSTPNPTTVAALAMTSDASVSGADPGCGLLARRSKKRA